ncbi:hypothetical protein TKK_0019566 [Trichogramma kaykai]|uniref:Heparanase n=1 Tax=Trichogramma kaykai TaxID=54128 RepID=A0ABD2VSM2_9HYME
MSGKAERVAVRNCAIALLLALFTATATTKVAAGAAAVAVTEELTLNVNVKKPLAVVSDKFLSITLDPLVLLNADTLGDVEKSTNLAQALAPAYVRIAGPRSNSHVFQGNAAYQQDKLPSSSFKFTDKQWTSVNEWAKKSGLELIASVAPLQPDATKATAWDSRNALELIAYSDRMNYNTSWQVGYECEERCDMSGGELGRYVQRLRSMLDAFPRYAAGSVVAGPDIVAYKTRQQQQFLQDFFYVAANALNVVTWHPEFAGVSIDSDGVSMHHDNLAADKDSLYRFLGRHLLKKPLWIAESRPEDCKKQFLGALVWTRRLGNAAKSGVQVIMRQPEDSDLFKTSPDYWVSVLHKKLVGPEVLDAKITSGNKTHVHFYCQCTKASDRYERGSLTIFGINLTPTKVTVNLKGFKPKLVHKYILLPGYEAENRMFVESVLLNNEPLNLVEGKRLPNLQPAISSSEKGVKIRLASGAIGFWVLPDIKIKACMGTEDESSHKNEMKRTPDRLISPEVKEENELDDDEGILNSTSIISLEEAKQLPRFQQRRSAIRRNMKQRELEKEKVDKVLRRRDYQIPNLKSGIKRATDDGSDEVDESLEKDVEGMDSGEVIRAKLHKYKKRLMEHEERKRQRELENLSKKRSSEKQEKAQGMDTEKVIEALTLISKVENAMKSLEKEAGRSYELAAPVAAAAPTSSKLNSKGQDLLLEEVLNTEKAKRTSVPAQIEEQLKALYRLLSDENEDSQRKRRNLDEAYNPSNDQYVYQYTNPYPRPVSKYEQAKERFLERREERRQRFRERQEMRRASKEPDSKRESSIDGVTYVYPSQVQQQQQQPSLAYASQSMPAYSPTYNYPAVDPNRQQYAQSQQTRTFWKRENANAAAIAPQEISDNSRGLKSDNPGVDANNNGTKEKALVKLIKYYEKPPQERQYDLTELKSQPQAQYQPQIVYPQTLTLEQSSKIQEYKPTSVAPNIQTEQPATTTSDRSKRHVAAIEELLNKEMLSEDTNNSQDCQCRVIRGSENCKECNNDPRFSFRHPLPQFDSMESHYYRNPFQRGRFKRQIMNPYAIPYYTDGFGADMIEPEAVYSIHDPLENSEISQKVPAIENDDCDSNEASEVIDYAVSPQNPFSPMPKHEAQADIVPSKAVESEQKFFLESAQESFDAGKEKEISNTNIATPKPSDGSERPNAAFDEHSKITESDNVKVDQIQTTEAQFVAPDAIEQSSIKIENSTTENSPEALDKSEVNATTIAVEETQKDDIDTKNKTANVTENPPTEKKLTKKESKLTTALGLKTPVQKLMNAELKATSLKQKPGDTLSKNSSSKPADFVKTASGKVSVRSEALAALAKENENKRQKKMIERSMRAIDIERAKLEEFQKKRHDQLERLKIKLRAKRDKMLQQYKEKLIEAIIENSDFEDHKLQRRATDEYDPDRRAIERLKDMSFMKYKPTQYSDLEDDSDEIDFYISSLDKVKPRKKHLPETLQETYDDEFEQKEQLNVDEDSEPSLEIPYEEQDFNSRYLSQADQNQELQNDDTNHDEIQKSELIKRSHRDMPEYVGFDLPKTQFYRYDEDTARYKREASQDVKTDSPLAFDLGLGNSKITRRKVDNTLTHEVHSRKKRSTDQQFNSKVTNILKKSYPNKNIKKVYKNHINSGKNEKLSKLKSKVLFNIYSKRLKRSAETIENENHSNSVGNSIGRSNDLELNAIWQNIMDLQSDEDLIHEYDNQRNDAEKKQLKNVTDIEESTTVKPSNPTSQANIESLLVDSIPKIQTVINSELKKAKNITGSFESFIENFDEAIENSEQTTSNLNEQDFENSYINQKVFQFMTVGIKKFFDFLQNFTQVVIQK